jgi:hypothetical protein
MNITVSGTVITALRDHSPGCMILRPQASSDSAAGQTLVPHDMRVPLVGYWRDGVLVIEKATEAPADEVAGLKKALNAAMKTNSEQATKLEKLQQSHDALLARSVTQAMPTTPTDPVMAAPAAEAETHAPADPEKLRRRLMSMKGTDFETYCAELGLQFPPGTSRTKAVEEVLAKPRG